MQICPICASKNIYFSKKRQCYACEDCDNYFDAPLQESGYRIFISYGHDDNQELVLKIKEYLANKGYDVWIDSSSIKKGSDWRERIVDGLIASNGVLAFLSEHSTRNPGVCLDELRIALRLKHAYVKSILLESEEKSCPPYHLSEGQWVDMKDWKDIPKEEWDNYFNHKMDELIEALESSESKELEEQLAVISSKLSINEQIGKEQTLLKEEFFGRKWLTEQVQDWLEHSNNNRMMILGVPGSGKSAFSANFTQYSVDVIGTIYFSWDNDSLKNIDKVIKYLAYKLSIGVSDYRRMLYSILTKESKKLDELHDSSLFDWLVLNPLSCCINTSRDNHLLIFDGLDETSQDIASFFFRKAAALPNWIKTLFTSRYDETSLSIYSSALTVVLNQNEKRNVEDIKEYISHRLGINKDSKEMEMLVDRFEGSFMYAKTFSSAVLDHQISLDDISSIPYGLNEFYLEFFNRLFPSYDDFKKVRPLFELMCVDEQIINPILCYALGIDKYSLWEIRHSLKSLIVSNKTKDEMKTIRFVHKSIYDWIQNEELSNQYHVDKKNGYEMLIKACEDIKTNGKHIVIDNYGSSEDTETIDKYINDFLDNRCCWLVKASHFKEYKQILLNSFDKESIKINDYMHYYRYVSIWRWADFFPSDEDVSEVSDKLTELVTYPSNWFASRFAHRSTQVCALILAYLIKTPRYKDVFFKFIDNPMSGYFMSRASDLDGETRGGWDKYYYTYYINICLKTLEGLHVNVPDNVKRACERCKLTFNYCDGDPKEGMFMSDSKEQSHPFTYGLLCNKPFYKDICVYDPENDTFRGLKKDYNTLSLRYYFIYGDDEDNEYVKKCAEHLADFKYAAEYALNYLSQKGNVQRCQYIESLLANK